jgi:acyl-CoA reductase-like NAD-dependent aldehyde dehydrogenase
MPQAARPMRARPSTQRGAFERGGLSPDPVQRAVLLLRWADRLAKRGDLAHLLTLENGKVLAQSQHEICTAIACLRRPWLPAAAPSSSPRGKARRSPPQSSGNSRRSKDCRPVW